MACIKNVPSNHYEMMSMEIYHMIVYNWTDKYSKMIENIRVKLSHIP